MWNYWIISSIHALLLMSIYSSASIVLLPDDPEEIAGGMLRMWCTVSSPDSSLRASDLIISVLLRNGNSLLLNSSYVQQVNETTLELNYPDLPVSFNDAHIICKEKDPSNTTDANVQILFVGYRPFLPVIKKDYKVYNWKYFIFTWKLTNETDPIYRTKYEAWYKTWSDVDFTNCNSCTTGQSCQKRDMNTCKIPDVLNKVHPSGELTFKVNGSNAVGVVSTKNETANLYHIIQPGVVQNVTVESSVSSGVVAQFYPPTQAHRLRYRVNVTCGDLSWDPIVLKNLSNSKPIRWKANLPFPLFTKCHLSVSCLPFNNRNIWSEWSETVSFTSPDGVPLSSPEVCCFESETGNSNFRNVTLYFKHLSDAEARGKVVRYVAQFSSSRTDLILPHTGTTDVEPENVALEFQIYRETSYKMFINAETRAGLNYSVASKVFIPSQQDLLSNPQNATAIYYESQVVRVSWLPMEDVSNYTVVWCKAVRYDSICKESLSWRSASCGLYHDIKLPPGESHLDYRFGLVAVSVNKERSSGIKWIRDLYNINEGAPAPQLKLFNKTSGSISLHLVRDGSPSRGKEGYIYEYWIYYKTKSENVTLKRKPEELERSDWTVTMNDLQPDTDYNFHVVAVTYKGLSSENNLPITTSSVGGLSPIVWGVICVVLLVALVLILSGIYTCIRCHQNIYLRIRKWFNMEITVPQKQSLDRGVGDGKNLSSSYTSLSRNEEHQTSEVQLNQIPLSDKTTEEIVSIVIPFEKEQSGGLKSSASACRETSFDIAAGELSIPTREVTHKTEETSAQVQSPEEVLLAYSNHSGSSSSGNLKQKANQTKNNLTVGCCFDCDHPQKSKDLDLEESLVPTKDKFILNLHEVPKSLSVVKSGHLLANKNNCNATGKKYTSADGNNHGNVSNSSSVDYKHCNSRPASGETIGSLGPTDVSDNTHVHSSIALVPLSVDLSEDVNEVDEYSRLMDQLELPDGNESPANNDLRRDADYSQARILPEGTPYSEEAEEGDSYSNAILSDEMSALLDATEARPIYLDAEDNNSNIPVVDDGSGSSFDDQRTDVDDDDDHNDCYAQATMIHKPR